jgi:hypothetical protein
MFQKNAATKVRERWPALLSHWHNNNQLFDGSIPRKDRQVFFGDDEDDRIVSPLFPGNVDVASS